jgi:hypothetical protein
MVRKNSKRSPACTRADKSITFDTLLTLNNTLKNGRLATQCVPAILELSDELRSSCQPTCRLSRLCGIHGQETA